MSEIDSRSIARKSSTDRFEKSYLDYAMSVMLGKSLARRFATAETRCTGGAVCIANWARLEQAYKKKRTRVCDVIGNYGIRWRCLGLRAIVAMAQHFSSCAICWSTARAISARRRRPAGRRLYTEVRMSKLRPRKLLADLDKETVDFTPTSDDVGERGRPFCRRVSRILLLSQLAPPLTIAFGMRRTYCRTIYRKSVIRVHRLIDNPPSRSRTDEILPGSGFSAGAGIINGAHEIVAAYKTAAGGCTCGLALTSRTVGKGEIGRPSSSRSCRTGLTDG